MEVGTNFVWLASTKSVALSATRLEETSTLASITYDLWLKVNSRTTRSNAKDIPAE